MWKHTTDVLGAAALVVIATAPSVVVLIADYCF